MILFCKISTIFLLNSVVISSAVHEWISWYVVYNSFNEFSKSNERRNVVVDDHRTKVKPILSIKWALLCLDVWKNQKFTTRIDTREYSIEKGPCVYAERKNRKRAHCMLYAAVQIFHKHCLYIRSSTLCELLSNPGKQLIWHATNRQSGSYNSKWRWMDYGGEILVAFQSRQFTFTWNNWWTHPTEPR